MLFLLLEFFVITFDPAGKAFGFPVLVFGSDGGRSETSRLWVDPEPIFPIGSFTPSLEWAFTRSCQLRA